MSRSLPSKCDIDEGASLRGAMLEGGQMFHPQLLACAPNPAGMPDAIDTSPPRVDTCCTEGADGMPSLGLTEGDGHATGMH